MRVPTESRKHFRSWYRNRRRKRWFKAHLAYLRRVTHKRERREGQAEIVESLTFLSRVRIMESCPTICAYDPLWTTADYLMEVPGLGIAFVARLPAYQRAWGPEFTPAGTKAAWLRAASTLAHMGLVQGVVFEFLRLGIPWLTSDVATFLNVPEATVLAWEAETLPLPLHAYTALAVYVDQKDGRGTYPMGAAPVPPPSYRPRVIRVYPDIPQESHVDPVDFCADACDC